MDDVVGPLRIAIWQTGSADLTMLREQALAAAAADRRPGRRRGDHRAERRLGRHAPLGRGHRPQNPGPGDICDTVAPLRLED